MPRKKGTPKTGGRKKGTPNKTTADLKQWVFDFINGNLDAFIDNFKQLDQKEQFNIMLKLLPYVLPKQTENKISMDEQLAQTVKESMEKVNEMFK